MQIKARPFLKYTLMPQVVPRIQGLFFSGFSYMAFFMAQIYRVVRLLPDGHPYLNPANTGRFGVRHVIAEAGNNLTISRENIDQVLVFAMMFFGLVLICVQMFILLVSGFVSVAHAAPNIFGAQLYPSSTPTDFFLWFKTPTATHDVAFVLLDRVFGIPGTAGPGTSFFADKGGGFTCVVELIRCFDLGQNTRYAGAPMNAGIDRMIGVNYNYTGFTLIPFPWPYHDALRAMLQVYSVGLLVVGIFIFIYFAFALAVETAQTGTPFGRRFNHIWAPLRIVTAMGLLVPIAWGLNPAQWILLYAVKWGSSFATNGWIIYTDAFAGEESLLGDTDTLIATPSTPSLNNLMEFASVLSACYEAYTRIYHDRTGRPAVDLNAWIINPRNIAMAPRPLATTTFAQAVNYSDRGSIIVRFGELRNQEHQSYDGRVAPFCGEVILDLTYVTGNMTINPLSGAAAPGTTEPGSLVVLDRWYRLIRDIWCSASAECGAPAAGLGINFHTIIGVPMANRLIAISNDLPAGPLPRATDLTAIRTQFETYVQQAINDGVLAQRTSTEWQEQLMQLGWAGAAIWYNKIAQLNGGLVSAVYAIPMVKKYPYVMELAKKERNLDDSGVSGETAYRGSRSSGSPMELDDRSNKQIVDLLDETRNLWQSSYTDQSRSSNFFIDAINMVLGTDGLFNITANETQGIHPLAQLASIGRSIVDSAIRNLGAAVAGSLGGGLANLFQMGMIGSFASTAGGFLFQVAMIGLSIGFVLFYIIPFLPFIYFFFAVGTWIKAIFEAMVGVPLWALAHIRIDGDGLPGHAAMGGYYLILEIFLRPILIVFGFIASMTIFAAQVSILHEIWPLVVSNAAGFDETASGAAAPTTPGSIDYLRHAVDEFFFTIIYAIICYMMGMGSFKLIDQVPNHLLRWMGASVSTFGDQAGDPAQNLVRNAFIATNTLGREAKSAIGGMQGAASGGQQALGALFSRQRGG